MSSINLGPRDLEAILAVAQHGSFRAAAAALSLSQPSVSARVRHAEDILGVKLFHRTTRRVTITRHGERLAQRAEQAMAELLALAKEFKEESRLQRGRVIVGATPSISSSILPRTIQRFRKRWPGIEVVLQDDFFARALDRVHVGEVDFAVTPIVEGDERFECEPLTQERFVLLVPEVHPLARGRTVALEAATRFPVLTLPLGTGTRDMLTAAYHSAGLAFRPAFETHNMMSVVALVKAGFGVAYVPSGVLPLFDMGGLKMLQVRDAALTLTISITRARGRAVQPPAEAFVQSLHEAVASGGL